MQGLAAAAATREAARLRGEAAKRKREAEAPTDAKRAARVVPIISHEVAMPKDFDEAARGLDPKLYGKTHLRKQWVAFKVAMVV